MLLRAKCYFPWSIGWMGVETFAGPGSSWTTLAGSELGHLGKLGPSSLSLQAVVLTTWGEKWCLFPSGPHWEHDSIHAMPVSTPE